MRRHQRARAARRFPTSCSRFTAGSPRCSRECRPDCVAIENLFYAVNVRSALKLGHARGVAMLAAVEAGVPVVEYTPAEIKRAVVGYGRAEKPQVQQMVKLLLGLAAVPSPHDAADALAVAICHVHSQPPARADRRRRSRRAAGRRAGGTTGRTQPGDAGAARPHDRDRASARHASSKSIRTASSSTSTASATTCSCRCRRSTASASRAPTIALRIHTHVREDALLLYGFATLLEQELFERLIGVSGIGPKLALAVLSGIEPPELIRAIERGDLARLTAIPGVGKKTSERIVLELKDRLPRAQAGGGGRRRRAAGRAGAARRCALGAREPGVSSAARRESRRRRDQDARIGVRRRLRAHA